MAEPATATLTATTDPRGREVPKSARRPLQVQFNPEKLELTLTNPIPQDRGRRRREPPQVVIESNAKLSLELLFDTTATGDDVRRLTFEVAQMLQPRQALRRGVLLGVPSIVLFEWGSFVFTGFIDSYKETLDFFAPEGVPLRSTLSLSLTEQGKPFPEPRPLAPGADGREVVPARRDASVQSVASELGLSRQAAQAIARESGVEDLRALGVDQIAVPSEALPRPPEPLANLAPPGLTPPTNPGVSPNSGAGAFAGIRAGQTGLGGIGGALAAFEQLRTPPEIRIETPRLDLGGLLGGGATASLDLRAGIGIGGTASAGMGLGASAGAAGGLGAGGGIVADVGASASASIIIEEA
jgi:hypothetical protein